ncbi:MAG: HDIG domain-containing metalloprotein [Thermodesulforhabdaceae bacterium]
MSNKIASVYSHKMLDITQKRIVPYWKRWLIALLLTLFITALFTVLYWKRAETLAETKIPLFEFIILLTILCAVTLTVPFNIGMRHFGSLKLSDKDVLLLAIIIAIYAVISFWLSHFQLQISGGKLGSQVFPFGSDLELVILAIPITAAPMIVTTFFNVALAYILSFTLCFVVTLLSRGSLWVFMYFFMGAILSAHLLHPYHDRIKPIRTGLWVALFQTVLIFMSLLIVNTKDWSFYLSYAVVTFVSGLLSGVLASGFIPLVEYLLGYTTDMRLMELASMDHPLLRELMIQAPGTYHHSMIVGTMAEAAARSIGAKGLLAKVAAYYHDIGKIKKPLYFIENQFGCENRHEKLAPSMSSLILISHVKDGVELAKQYKIGRPIIDIIQQHHGTSLISYFYNKALELRSKIKQHKKGVELPPVNIEDYRYPGPKPQTKEAGLVMLADMAEAACRSLPNPTPARIQGMVSKIINQAFTDGQLDDCELTLRDLHQIAKHFYQILAAIHHKRIEYPQQQATEARKGAKDEQRSDDSKRPNGAGDRSGEAEKGSQPCLRRLGL